MWALLGHQVPQRLLKDLSSAGCACLGFASLQAQLVWAKRLVSSCLEARAGFHFAWLLLAVLALSLSGAARRLLAVLWLSLGGVGPWIGSDPA